MPNPPPQASEDLGKGKAIFSSNQSESWNSKLLSRCGAQKLTFPEIFKVFRMAQMAHLAEVARSFMGLGEYTVKQQFSSSEDKSKGTKLMETVGKVKMDEVKKEMKKLNAERLRMAGPPRIQGRGYQNVAEENDSASDGGDEEETEEEEEHDQEEEEQQLQELGQEGLSHEEFGRNELGQEVLGQEFGQEQEQLDQVELGQVSQMQLGQKKQQQEELGQDQLSQLELGQEDLGPEFGQDQQQLDHNELGQEKQQLSQPPQTKTKRTISFSPGDSSPEVPKRFNYVRTARPKIPTFLDHLDDLQDLSSDSGDDKDYHPNDLDDHDEDEENANIKEVSKELEKLANKSSNYSLNLVLEDTSEEELNSSVTVEVCPKSPEAAGPPGEGASPDRRRPGSQEELGQEQHSTAQKKQREEDQHSQEKLQHSQEKQEHSQKKQQQEQEVCLKSPEAAGPPGEGAAPDRRRPGSQEELGQEQHSTAQKKQREEDQHSQEKLQHSKENRQQEQEEQQEIDQEGDQHSQKKPQHIQKKQQQHSQEKQQQEQEEEQQELDQEHAYDPHPTITLLGRGTWELPGVKEPIYVNPQKNTCSLCKNRTKGSWCTHLVSAGLREGNIYRGKVYKLPLKKCMKAQQPKGNSGTKAPRKHDYKPAPADVQEAHQIHVVEEDPDLPEAGHEAGTVRGQGQGGPGLSAGPSGLGGGGDGGPAGAAPKEPGLPDIVVTPSTPKVFSRPRQSQGLLYKHLCNSFIHSVGHSVMVCENIFVAATP